MLYYLKAWFSRKPPQTSDPSDPIDEDNLPSVEKLLVEIELLSATDPETVELAVLYDKLGRAYVQQADRYEVYYSAVAKPIIEAFQQAAVGYKRQGNTNAQTAVLWRLASSYIADSKFTEAIQAGKDALATAKITGNRWQMMMAFAEMGRAELHLGKPHKSLGSYRKSLRIAKSIHAPRAAAIALSNLGNCWSQQEFHWEAIRRYKRALKIHRQIGDRLGETHCLTCIAQTYETLKRRKRALKYFQQALAVQHEVGNQHEEAVALIQLGHFYLSPRQFEKALEFYQQSRELAKKISDSRGEAIALACMGNTYTATKHFHQAIMHHQRALKIFEELGERYEQSLTAQDLARAHYHADPRSSQPISFLQQAIILRQELGDSRGEANVLWQLAGVYADQGDDLSAKQALEQALAIGLELNDIDIISHCKGAIGGLERSLKTQARKSQIFEQKPSQRPFKETKAFDPNRVAVYKTLPIWVWLLFVGFALVMLLAWIFD